MNFRITLVVSLLISLGISGFAQAFELASEGTMSSVVITAANSAEELKHAASTPDGYVGGDYELMPFKTSVSIAIDDIDDSYEDFEYEQVQLAEQQVENVRQKEEDSLLASAIRAYLPPSVTDVIESGTTEVMEGFAAIETASKQAVNVVFGQLEQTYKLVSASMDSISHEITRYTESFSANNVRFSPDDEALGNFHVSDMHSVSHITLSEHE